MNGINLLSDPTLLNAYYEAVKLELEKEFIEILVKELNRRKISIPN